MAMFLRLDIEGVDEARILVGLRAAMAVFEAHKVHSYTADEGRWAAIVADETGDELLPRHAELGRIWAWAEAAAIDAACTLDDGQRLASRGAQLSVLDDQAPAAPVFRANTTESRMA